MRTIPHAEWKWFGNAAHFICGQWCRFHLATQVGDYLISTVGEYVHPSRSNGSEAMESAFLIKNPVGETIGCDRHFETMVFKAGTPCQVEDCGCGLPSVSGSELDFDGYNDRKSATLGHRAMCEKWAKDGAE